MAHFLIEVKGEKPIYLKHFVLLVYIQSLYLPETGLCECQSTKPGQIGFFCSRQATSSFNQVSHTHTGAIKCIIPKRQ